MVIFLKKEWWNLMVAFFIAAIFTTSICLPSIVFGKTHSGKAGFFQAEEYYYMYPFLSGVLINFVTNLLKTPMFKSVLKLLSPKYRAFIPLIIGLSCSGIALLSGVSIHDSIMIVFGGPISIGIHELVTESLMNGYKTRK